MIRLKFFLCAFLLVSYSVSAADSVGVLEFPAKGEAKASVVLVAGDEEYRSEESMPMLAKILSVKHGFRCTVVFSVSEDGTYIDPNNQAGVVGLEALSDADLMIIGTRFRKPDPEQAKYVTEFLDAGKPVIGIRTATHAFNGQGDFGGSLSYGRFGLEILGEQWVNHHGRHKSQGCRGVIEKGSADHPILNSVSDVFAPSDVYGVKHLTESDKILLRGAVTASLDPKSEAIDGDKNDPMQALAWLHSYTSPAGKKGNAFCTTAGASVDLVSEDLRRMIVNAAYHLTGRPVPDKADVAFVDPFYPTFYGFIREEGYFKRLNMKASDFALGKSPHFPDPKNSPEWPFRDRPSE